ncbi:hypothetical protein CKO11_15095 [Rhodobacter sp. TJ_12]|uniref:hypothetical protein n=1 Tax=Rhodobacter sp. TJ_12 TaxID=2029399 RepID=UPI001CBC1883|nr:hypothetical protein [Rhodobacter sp. TJ_12]MBZ4023777.1 hypothetical protein [Rhodobacter sp. TJ_12]
MRNTFALAAAALALSAGFASAAEPNQGLKQIASYLGVDAGAYSANELHQLLAARSSGDQSTYAYLLDRNDRSNSTRVSAGKAQIAAQAELDPAQYTTAELILIDRAQREGRQQDAEFYINHENRNDIYHPVPRRGRDS